ncbi:MAG: methionyl-tRNA formyltransferase [Clostridia bacterium]|nr:methionyl-tRNA formyltransferase [Clostridia bacterium]
MKIVFMGTPEFALYSLEAISSQPDNEIVAVLTQADKPRGRGYALTPTPVKVWATERNIPVYQPATLRDGAFEETLRELDPDLIVVTAYGKILPQYVLDYPRYGCINVHTSLLPRHRGAAPMQRAILAGDTVTGVSVQQMDAGIDTGDVLVTREIPIGPDDNLETVHDNLGLVSREALCETLTRIKEGTLSPVKQDETHATHAAKIEKSDCLIDFTADAQTVHNQIRALSPMPLAFTYTPDGKLLKIPQSRPESRDGENSCVPGTVVSLDGAITVACGRGTISLLTVLPEGKGRMAAADYIRGRKLAVGDRLGKN